MATTLALAMRASMSASGVVSGANDAAKAMDRMGKQAERTAKDMSVLKNLAIGAALLKGASVLANTLKSAASSVRRFTSHVNSAADSLQDLADRIDISVESLQVFQMAAKLSGVDDLTGALQRLAVSIGNAAESGDTKAFESLGLDFEALQAMSPEEQFKAVQRAIAALPTPAQRAAAAVAIFGKAGVELLPLMNQNLQEIEDRMRRLGAVMSNDQVAAIGEMNDALDMVRAMFDGIIGQVMGNLAPIVTALADELMRVVEGFNGVNGQGGTGIANAITEALFEGAEYLAGVFDRSAVSFHDFASTMQTVADIFSFVGNVFVGVAELFKAYITSWSTTLHAQTAVLLRLAENLPMIPKQVRQNWKEQRVAEEKMAEEGFASIMQSLTNAGNAFANAFTGESGQPQQGGAAAEAVRAMRDRFRESQTPEAKAARKAEQARRDEERKRAAEEVARQAKAARDAAAAEKAKKDQEAQRQRLEREQKERDRKVRAVDEKMAGKQEEIDKVEAEKAAALSGKSNEALKANDIRSTEGMAQFIALATGREDPAIEENRKTNQKLEEIRQELRALQQERVEILGAAA